MAAAHNFRYGARAVILDAEDRAFLLRCELPGFQFWLAPGGGVEPGESLIDALDRELQEELGLTGIDILQKLWHQAVVGDYASGYDGVVNDYFLVRVADAFTPGGPTSASEFLVENITGYRWWTLEELMAAREHEEFSPRELPLLLRQLLKYGPPPAALQIAL